MKFAEKTIYKMEKNINIQVAEFRNNDILNKSFVCEHTKSHTYTQTDTHISVCVSNKRGRERKSVFQCV